MDLILPTLITCALAFTAGYLFARGVRPRAGSERV
jgi:hypothetical protein